MLRRDLLKLLPGLALAPALSVSGAAQAQRKPDAPSAGLGLNLAPVTYWTSEHVFANLAKSASRWRLQELNGPFSWDLQIPLVSQDGYPLEIPSGSFVESFLVFTPLRQHLPQTLTVLYDGEGSLEYLAGGALARTEPGRDVVRDLKNDGPIIARLHSTTPQNPLRNVRVFEGDEPGGQTFRSAFLDRLSGMSVLRFMDWMETNNSKLVRWDERPRHDRYAQTEGGVALEFMVELANASGIPPWFTMPHLADDDYVRAFAEQVRSTLDPALGVHVEYSNEVWNGLFEQSLHAQKEGLRLGLSANRYEAGLRFHSQRTSQILTIWEDVFAGDRQRVVGVYAAHAANPWSSEVVLSWADAKDHADVLAVAPYFGGSLGDRQNAPDVARWSLDQLFAALEDEIDNGNREFILRQADMARRFDVRLVAYEGGQHLVGYSGTAHDETLHTLFADANNDERMGEMYRRHIDHWRAAGGSTYALYHSMGQYSKWGCWGLLESEAATASAPKWRAVREMIEASTL